MGVGEVAAGKEEEQTSNVHRPTFKLNANSKLKIAKMGTRKSKRSTSNVQAERGSQIATGQIAIRSGVGGGAMRKPTNKPLENTHFA